ncbi:MAG: cryptochrome/photolyase family protein [Myxococcales bacterium]|nr:cryptochrome/photolyase family protein [Myxococcales bacterium]USN50732.1 MAG: cryptochrome/photolyase family protein [Myxococcales bacterium]
MFLLMGSHLFDPNHLAAFKDKIIVMIEDYGLCTHFRYHKQKLIFFLEAMRNHRDLLRSCGFNVHYSELKFNAKPIPFVKQLEKIIKQKNITELTSFSIEDKFFRQEINELCIKQNLSWMVYDSPLFLNNEREICEALSDKRPLMKNFYQSQRVSREILLTKNQLPLGGKFSFDNENRLRLPKNIVIPLIAPASPSIHQDKIVQVVTKFFQKHPGDIAPWLPTTRAHAKKALHKFIQERLISFGPYEDAIQKDEPFLFHSVLSPLINCGLLTPQEILDETLKNADSVPLNSLEGFVRQILGWREFIRGIYEKFSYQQKDDNFFGHQRKLAASWYSADTSILPLDTAIKKAQLYGYCHHIERLMIISNIMLLCEIHPLEAYRWFMEMFVDSADWVMGPNVFGMGQFSDGGLFTTKPYICGSNYILKMSNYTKDDWCDTLDGLYWRFIDKHKKFFLEQPRLSMMPKLLDRIGSQRKNYLFKKAQQFIELHTI